MFRTLCCYCCFYRQKKDEKKSSNHEDFWKHHQELATAASKFPNQPLFWGWPYEEYKRNISCYIITNFVINNNNNAETTTPSNNNNKRRKRKTTKHQRIPTTGTKIEFSYPTSLLTDRRLSQEDANKYLWSSVRYSRGNNSGGNQNNTEHNNNNRSMSTCMKPKTKIQLLQMNFGLKQKGGYYVNNAMVERATIQRLPKENQIQCFCAPIIIKTTPKPTWINPEKQCHYEQQQEESIEFVEEEKQQQQQEEESAEVVVVTQEEESPYEGDGQEEDDDEKEKLLESSKEKSKKKKKNKSSSFHGNRNVKQNETAMFHHQFPKRGKGTMHFNRRWGCNKTITVILTRFDDDGNVQTMVLVPNRMIQQQQKLQQNKTNNNNNNNIQPCSPIRRVKSENSSSSSSTNNTSSGNNSVRKKTRSNSIDTVTTASDSTTQMTPKSAAEQRQSKIRIIEGEYELGARCQDFRGVGHKVLVDDTYYKIQGNDVMDDHDYHGSNYKDETGRLVGKGLAYARATMLEKLSSRKGPEAEAVIKEWLFYEIARGIVDDPHNTVDSWMESSYVIHHITGQESKEILKLFSDFTTTTTTNNNHGGVTDEDDAIFWRCIDIMPNKSPPKSQVVITNTNNNDDDDDDNNNNIQQTININNCGYNTASNFWKYDPYVEFELWYADHSFVAAMVCDFIKDHYVFERKGYHGFGVSKLRLDENAIFLTNNNKSNTYFQEPLKMTEGEVESGMFT